MVGITFWLKRGADLFVYISVMALFYLVLSMFAKLAYQNQKQTDLIRTISVERGIGSLQSASIVFVIPAYNESDHCFDVVQEVLDAGYGVVFVDDGSNNGLFDRLQKRFSAAENLILIRHIVNLGQWAALQTGFSYLLNKEGIDYVVTFDSDGQHRLSDLPNFIKAFEDDTQLEIALGSRFLGSTVNMPWVKKIALKVWILFTFLFSWLWLTDTHNGYRMIKFSSLKKIKLTFNGMEHASEILDLIGQQKLHYKEVPNTIIYTDYSMARGQKLSNSLRIVKNLLFDKFFG